MATIVQPYNPWREQLALTALGNIAGDIIGDMWKTHRQNEQNRKINAFRGELQNLAQQQKDNISLTQPQAPQGYNSNPWANALHQSYSPLTQFDIGTAGIGKTPSLQDIERNADTLAASKRFSMLSPETVQGVKNSMMQNAVASLFGNAADWGGKINAFGLGVANGVVPYQAMTALSQLYVHDNPHFDFNDVNIGTHNITIARNPKDGTASPVLISPIGMSEYQRASLQNQKDIANIHAGANMYGDDLQYKTDSERNAILRDQQEYEQTYPPQTIYTGADGEVVTYNQRKGTAKTLRNEQGKPVRGETGHYQVDVQRLKSLDNEYDELSDEKKAYSKVLTSIAYTPEEKEIAKNVIKELDSRMAKNRAIYEDLYNRTNPAQPTVTEVPASADVPMRPNAAPITQSADQQPKVTALPTESADVTPKLPSQVSADQNFSDFRPSYLGELQPLTAISTLPQAPAQPIQHQARKTQPRTIQLNMRDFDMPDDMAYDPVRDKDIDSRQVLSRSGFNDLIDGLRNPNSKLYDKKYARLSTEQMINLAYRAGIKIKD